MNTRFIKLIVCACIVSGLWSSGPALSQEPPPPPPGGPDGRGARGPREGGPPPTPPPSPEERLVAQLQQMLGCGDEEWAVLGPKISHIQQLISQRERFTKPKPPRPPRPVDPNGRGPAPDEDNRALFVDLKSDPRKDAQAGSLNGNLLQIYSDLVVLVSGGDVPSSRLQTLLAQYREARAASDAQLAKARTELRELVTVRQEVILVVTGILE